MWVYFTLPSFFLKALCTRLLILDFNRLHLFRSPTYFSWWVPCLAKGCRKEVTQIMAPILALSVYSSPTPQAIPILCQMEFRSPTYGFLVGAILVKGCRPDFNNGLGGDSNNGPILSPQLLFESDSNSSPSPGHANPELQTCISPNTILCQL